MPVQYMKKSMSIATILFERVVSSSPVAIRNAKTAIEETKEAAKAFGIMRQKQSITRLVRAARMERNIFIPPIKEKFRNIDVQACCGTQHAPLNAARSPA